MHLKDYEVRNFLMSGMEIALKEMAEKQAKTDFSIGEFKGYVCLIQHRKLNLIIPNTSDLLLSVEFKWAIRNAQDKESSNEDMILLE